MTESVLGSDAEVARVYRAGDVIAVWHTQAKVIRFFDSRAQLLHTLEDWPD